jgi:hypothetical protein
MLSGRGTHFGSTRDLKIDFLRGLAMACVIIDHSKRSSLLSWFSYQRFWVVTAAEVFVVLSGVVLGMVYGPRLARNGLRFVVHRLGRRALTLYFAFVGVTLSVLALALAGVDVSAVASWDESAMSWFIDPRSMTTQNWRDLFLLHHGPWAFEIVGLYVWLVLAAVPCLIALQRIGWRWLLASSWAVYLIYRLAPYQLTASEFELVFPILAWQLLFVHGITIGYHRQDIAAASARCPKALPIGVGCACVVFMAFALSNPSVDGPAWLYWRVISPDRFFTLYDKYFSLTDLGIGRILNLGVALPVGYALLAWRALWGVVGRLQALFVTLGQGSLGAFVLHVYGLLLLAHLPETETLWINTIMQVLLIVGIAAALKAINRVPVRRRMPIQAHVQPVAA